MTRAAIVLGAGMVGVSTALALRERGVAVTLVDRRAPGEETSHGNAGIIQAEAVEPYAMPLAPKALLDIALGRTNDVRWHAAALPGLLGPLARYWRHSLPKRHREIARTYAQLARRATADHAPWIEAAGASELLTKTGLREFYGDPATLAAATKDAERLSREYGVGLRLLSPADIRGEEPLITRDLAGGIHWTESWSLSDPGGLTRAYADLFVKEGGHTARGEAESLTRSGAGWRVETEDGPIEANDVVIALGPWSPQLLKRFGYGVPMLRKRGYHRHYATRQALAHPFLYREAGAVCAPMRAGLRVTSGAELTRFSAAPDPIQLTRAEARLRDIMDLGEPLDAAPWMGHRPCMPDMLPLVGEAPRHPGLWLHFGHGHQGFTQGPTTARILAGLMTGEESDPLATALFYRF